jgi:phosphoribosylformimino-5-aminoimidazole carboxamide ribotide isomerase
MTSPLPSPFLILPAIDLRGGRCVRLRQGDYARETVYADDPAAQARSWCDQGGRVLHLVDLDGAKTGRPANLAAVAAIAAAVSVPCELGGGIRTCADAEAAFAAGVARIILGTVACEHPELVSELLAAHGPERIVVGIDAKDGRAAVRGWLDETGQDALALAAKFADLGVVRFIYTDIATDGMLTGPNLPAVVAFCDRVPGCQVIASGGIAGADDIRALRRAGKPNLEGAIVGRALYDGRVTLAELIAVAEE